MAIVVSGVGALIHIYSLGYMRDDEGKSRYFAALSLFMFAMLGIVFANNFVMLFIFWELVGFTSYVLIGHWFFRDAAADAANKAFITTRIGDFGFMTGILMIWMTTGSVVFAEVAPRMSMFGGHPTFVAIVALLIFCGAVGKSAQFPLHVWLPDAMEGPTPVSALIHAATMVAAGVYMLVRVAFIIQASQTALLVVAWIGTITAVMAALIATQQDDIKRILAYSTLSQLGYMVMAVGLASNQAAMFHLFTHAFFKALLFLAAGSVIVMLHHEQNIWKMGGLRRRLPITFATFGAGALALIGCPPFSGFFSKDAILAVAYEHNLPIFAVALFTAFLTAFYVIRMLVIVFFGNPRSDSAREGRESPPRHDNAVDRARNSRNARRICIFRSKFSHTPYRRSGDLCSRAGNPCTDSRSWTRRCSLPRTRDRTGQSRVVASQILFRRVLWLAHLLDTGSARSCGSLH